jgi:hypothetical protein
MKEVGSVFVNGGNYAQAANCSVWGDVFYSYSTPIAVRKDGMFYLTEEKFSTATSGQQNALKQLIPSHLLTIVSTEEIAAMAK